MGSIMLTHAINSGAVDGKILLSVSKVLGRTAYVAMLLSILPTDVWTIRVCKVLIFLAIAALVLSELSADKAVILAGQGSGYVVSTAFGMQPAWVGFWIALLKAADVVSLLIIHIGTVLYTTGRFSYAAQLDLGWCSLRLLLWVQCCLEATTSGILFSVNDLPSGFACFVAAFQAGLLGWVAGWPGFRTMVQGWLASKGEAVAAAASVAAIMGGYSPEELQAKAYSTLKAVNLGEVTKEEMAENTPNPEFAQKAKPAHVGNIDAFLSHSWHDNAESKWQALQEWRAEFKALHGREPTVWIDKFCIDQNNIEDNLACLPIFLASCQRLLVLCGSTYFLRMWCVIELFIFHQMGGKLQNIRCMLVESPSFEKSETTSLALSEQSTQLEEGEGSPAILKLLKVFDVRKATCFLEADADRLRDVIEAGFGTSRKFNKVIRRLLMESLHFKMDKQSSEPFGLSAKSEATEELGEADFVAKEALDGQPVIRDPRPSLRVPGKQF